MCTIKTHVDSHKRVSQDFQPVLISEKSKETNRPKTRNHSQKIFVVKAKLNICGYFVGAQITI